MRKLLNHGNSIRVSLGVSTINHYQLTVKLIISNCKIVLFSIFILCLDIHFFIINFFIIKFFSINFFIIKFFIINFFII